MAQPGPKQAIYSNLAQVAQAIGHSHRLELLEYMAQGPRSVEELSSLVGLTLPNTSRHLQVLRRARLADAQRQGKHVLYRLSDEPAVLALLKTLGNVGERNLSEVRQVMTDFFSSRDSLAPVSREELAARLRDGTVTVLDVRPEHEYRLGHLPGALNLPLDTLARRLATLNRDQEIVAYCRGPYCVLSFEAVAMLRERGYRARRLIDGFPEWKAEGLEVESV